MLLSLRQEGTQGQAGTEGRLRLRFLGWPRVTHTTSPSLSPTSLATNQAVAPKANTEYPG